MKLVAVPILAVALVGTSCSGDAGRTDLTVFAAASLTDAFTELGEAFQVENTGVAVAFNFGSSTDLAGQIASEGTADVFASASVVAMDAVAGEPGVEGRTDFATNSLVVIVPAGDPTRIKALEDLAKEGVQVVLGAEGVPVGDYAREALAKAGVADAVLANVVSNEEDNAAVVAKVAAGEADAAIVYESDVSAAAGNDVVAIGIPDDVNVTAVYPIAVVAGAANAARAHDFVAFVLSAEGQEVLRRHGFGPPGE